MAKRYETHHCYSDFRRCFGDLELQLLRTQARMCSRKPSAASLFFGANPNRPRAAYERKWIVANNFGWPFDFQLDGIIGKRPNGTEIIVDAHHHSRRVRAIADQSGIIGGDCELRIDASARHLLNNDLLSLYVALQAQIAPPVTKAWANIHHEWRVTEMLKLFAIWIGFGDQFVIDVDLDVIAIGTDYGVGKSDRFVPTRPMKGGLQHDFFRRVTLRFIESCRRLGLTEDVSDAVVADAVARAEIRMRVVIKCAPADATRVLRI